MPLTGISVTKLEDTESRKNAFEIRGALIDSIVAVCQSNADAEKWVSLLSQHLNPDIRNTMTSGSLPHSLSQVCFFFKFNLFFIYLLVFIFIYMFPIYFDDSVISNREIQMVGRGILGTACIT